MASILATKIVVMLIFMILGFIAAKAGVFKTSHASVFSALILFILNPGMIIGAFQRDATPELLKSLGLGIVICVLLHFLFILVGVFMKKVMHLNNIDALSTVYTNCGNIMIPLIISLSGVEDVVYSMPYIVVFTVFSWSHCKSTFKGAGPFSMKKLLTNINIIFIGVGLILMFLGINLPTIGLEITSTLSLMLGPIAMIMTGIVMADINFQKLKTYKHIPIVLIMRMLVCPGLFLLIIWATNILNLMPQERILFMVILLSASAPTANIVTQFSVMYGTEEEAEYSSAINILTTILCVVTMPLFIYLFEML